MKWNKTIIEEGNISGIIGVAILLIIISLYMHAEIILFLAVFLVAAVITNHLYLKKAGNLFRFENTNEKYRMFIDETGKWKFTFLNQGVPILKGELRFTFDHFVAPEHDHVSTSLPEYEIMVPFSIFTGQTKEVFISYVAKSRGIAKIRKIEIHIPSLFGFGETILESNALINQQTVVYPNPIPVKGLKEQLSFRQGDSPVRDSIYEHRNGYLGTRNYVPTDGFNQIHWKATAKKQVLQTKIYEKITDRGIMVALNISNGHSITAQLETLLSGITEFAYVAFRKNIPYSLCINVRTAGLVPFVYLPRAEGKEHLQRVLEIAASISGYSTSVPYQSMLSYYQRHMPSQPMMIHAGVRTEEIDLLLGRESQKGVRLMELTVEEEKGTLRPLMTKRERRRVT